MERIFVRTDRFGGYYMKDGKKETVTRPTNAAKDPLGPKILEQHFKATHTEHIVGAHPLTAGESVGRWVGVDLDAHTPKDDPDRNKKYAEHLVAKLTSIGIRPLACHWGTGGYHIWAFFNSDIPGAMLYAFAKWLVSDAKAEPWNYEAEIEVFPKQPRVPTDKCGNWLRVPGRHHTKRCFAAVFDGQQWVQGKPAVAYILGCSGDSSDLIPTEARTMRKESQRTASASPAFRAGAAAPGRQVRCQRPDAFLAFNQQTSLSTVAEWHTQKGHRVISSDSDRVEFIREGKDGSGQSFNVKVIDGVPVTYSFSTNAGMPPSTGMSPSQIRCFYETGSCDTAAMRRFAEKLREELGWNAKELGGEASPPEAPLIPRPWSDPVRLGESFLKKNIVMFVKKTGFFHDDGHYSATEIETIDDRCWTLAEREALAEYERRLAEYEGGEAEEDEEPPTAPQVTIPIVNNMVRAVRSATRFPDSTLPGAWLAEPEFEGPPLCVANGILNLRTRELFPHSPWLFTLTKIPVDYDPAAPKPLKFFRLLKELSCHDPDWILVMQEVFGACLDATLPWKRFTAFVGVGDNGKTVVLNVLRTLLGQGNHSAQTLAQLTGSQFGTFPLFGRLANIVGDESGFDVVKEGRLKELTGVEAIAFEQKNKTPFYGPNTAKLLFGCNKLPPFVDDTEGVWNRLIILPFEFVVPREQKKPAMLLPDFWAAELPGILNWALEGLQRVRDSDGTTEIDRVQHAVAAHRVESNAALRFLTECYKAATTEEHEVFVIASAVYDHYRAWLKSHGYDEKKHLLNSIAFGKQVPKAFPLATRDSARVNGKPTRIWRDIRRATPHEEAGVDEPIDPPQPSVTTETLYASVT